MGWARYLVAIAVGLAVGMAVGWYSGRSHEAAPRVAHHHHHRGQAVNLRPGRHQPEQGRPAPAPQTPRRPPSLAQLQSEVLQCLFRHPTPSGQTGCLRAVLRRELKAAGPHWQLPGGGMPPVLPFASLTQD
jgi:hypothetical protein